MYVGFSAQQQGAVRDALARAGIPCRLRVRNTMGQLRGGGQGTLRGSLGSTGQSQSLAYEYHVLVPRGRFEEAEGVAAAALRG